MVLDWNEEMKAAFVHQQFEAQHVWYRDHYEGAQFDVILVDGAPAGRLYHVALDTDGQIQVFDVWDSQESFDAFGETLMPVMTALGADPGQPMVSKVHNIIQG